MEDRRVKERRSAYRVEHPAVLLGYAICGIICFAWGVFLREIIRWLS